MSIGYHWKTSSLSHIEYGPLKSFNVDNEDSSDMFAQALHVAVLKDISPNWVKISGTEYRAGLVICIEIEHKLPLFCRIRKILS